MTWERAARELACGGCGREIPTGEPVALVTQARLVRCEPCAKRVFEAVAPRLEPAPAPPVMQEQPFAVRDFARRVRQDFDAKRAQAGEREIA